MAPFTPCSPGGGQTRATPRAPPPDGLPRCCKAAQASCAPLQAAASGAAHSALPPRPFCPCRFASPPGLSQPAAIIILEPAVARGGWNEQQQLSVRSPPRPAAAAIAPSPPRSPLPAAPPDQGLAAGGICGAGVGMSQIPEGSLSDSSHGSLGELGSPPEAELSELEQRKVVVLG